MTLVARPKAPRHHKKVTGKHHRHSKVYHKAYWPYLPLLALVGLGLFFNNTLPGKHGVLGYATDMSIQSLLDDTNAQRASNGESALALNSQLDSAAQSKANDMAARDYWSHNTPDGQAPWTFMSAAGYNYQLAGENLAYGFTTANDTLTGWMNSPGHRANILNAGYKEVGFGFININNYQGSGPQTLVVAMYGTQPQPAAAPAPVTPVAAPVTTVTKTVSGQAAGAATPQSTTPATSTTPTQTAATQPAANDTVTPLVQAKTVPKQITNQETPQTINRAQILTAGKAPWSMFVLAVIASVSALAVVLRHGFAWRKVLVEGEQFFIHHTAFDLAAAGFIILAAVLAHGAGIIL